MHTSTVTVAVLPIPDEAEYRLKENDLEIFTTRDSGPGGQHRNKTESAVVMRHKPTGLEAKAASKSQHQNRKSARATLEARVAAFYAARAYQERSQMRAEQTGSGMRGDKIRTYRVRDDQVTDHRVGKKMRLSRVLEGLLDG